MPPARGRRQRSGPTASETGGPWRPKRPQTRRRVTDSFSGLAAGRHLTSGGERPFSLDYLTYKLSQKPRQTPTGLARRAIAKPHALAVYVAGATGGSLA